MKIIKIFIFITLFISNIKANFFLKFNNIAGGNIESILKDHIYFIHGKELTPIYQILANDPLSTDQPKLVENENIEIKSLIPDKKGHYFTTIDNIIIYTPYLEKVSKILPVQNNKTYKFSVVYVGGSKNPYKLEYDGVDESYKKTENE